MNTIYRSYANHLADMHKYTGELWLPKEKEIRTTVKRVQEYREEYKDNVRELGHAENNLARLLRSRSDGLEDLLKQASCYSGEVSKCVSLLYSQLNPELSLERYKQATRELDTVISSYVSSWHNAQNLPPAKKEVEKLQETQARLDSKEKAMRTYLVAGMGIEEPEKLEDIPLVDILQSGHWLVKKYARVERQQRRT